MKALILAGGHATRLWPITKNRAKPLLPLGGKLILDYILDEVEPIEEIDKIYVTTNEKFEESFRDYLSDRESDKHELIIESQKSEEEKFGAVGGMMNVIQNQPTDDYLVIGGDNYYSFKIKDFIDFALERDSITNACFEVEDMEEAKNYGIVDFDQDNRIQEFQEKPEKPKSRMASTAFYYFPEEMLEVFDEYVDYWRGKIPREEYLDEPGRFLEWTVQEYETYAYPFTGQWVDIGTSRGYLRAEKEIGEGNLIMGEIEGSDIGDNVTILEGSKVENSEVDNSIIFGDCVVKDSIVKDSIVGDETEIVNMDVREALIKSMK